TEILGQGECDASHLRPRNVAGSCGTNGLRIEIGREASPVKLKPNLRLPVIFARKIPSCKFSSKCRRVIELNVICGHIITGALSWLRQLTRLHAFVGMQGFASERSHRKFPIPFSLSL